jgi:predicted TIM-barrel fold metal-dependent hydrolase
MIVDFHTHIFPPQLVRNRPALAEAEPVFAELYSSPKAALASAEELLTSMDAAGIDVSVALGFAWRDVEACRAHNDYLLQAAAASGGRILPFCTLPLAAGHEAFEAEAARCVRGGALGFGELRPDDLAFDLEGDAGRRLGEVATELKTRLLFHVSEPVGHMYPGKRGLAVASFYDFIAANPRLDVIGAHWGGGLPFYALMPEVGSVMARTSVDTAATRLLYGPDVYERVIGLIGAERVLFGSDFPLLSQARSRESIEAAISGEARELVLGGNAQRLLGLA